MFEQALREELQRERLKFKQEISKMEGERRGEEKGEEPRKRVRMGMDGNERKGLYTSCFDIIIFSSPLLSSPPLFSSPLLSSPLLSSPLLAIQSITNESCKTRFLPSRRSFSTESMRCKEITLSRWRRCR